MRRRNRTPSYEELLARPARGRRPGAFTLWLLAFNPGEVRAIPEKFGRNARTTVTGLAKRHDRQGQYITRSVEDAIYVARLREEDWTS